ncbi:MAG: universal stress protein [Desulfuromusa sp.]|jgi:nucleotide-binding universal stress UspA family protein|nr:universal stress protein [Desulfuromusa sp.]
MDPKIENILYATGLGSGDPYVFGYALSLARKYDANIHVIHGREPLPISLQKLSECYISHEEIEDILAEDEKTILNRIDQLCAKGIAGDPLGQDRVASMTVVRHPPKQAIIEEAQKRNVDLIVMGSHRHSVLSDAMLGTTTMKVLHQATIPVLVVRIPKGYQEEGV